MIAAAVVGRKSRTAPPTDDDGKRSQAAGHGSTGVEFEFCGAGTGPRRSTGVSFGPRVGRAGALSDVEASVGKAAETLARVAGGAARHGSTSVGFEFCGAGAGTERTTSVAFGPRLARAGAQSEVEVSGEEALETLTAGGGGGA